MADAFLAFIRTVARPLHQRHVDAVTRHTAARGRLLGIDSQAGAGVLPVHAGTLGGFVRVRWQWFNAEGWAANAAQWERALAAEQNEG